MLEKKKKKEGLLESDAFENRFKMRFTVSIWLKYFMLPFERGKKYNKFTLLLRLYYYSGRNY